jgi:hypothetical protein
LNPFQWSHICPYPDWEGNWYLFPLPCRSTPRLPRNWGNVSQLWDGLTVKNISKAQVSMELTYFQMVLASPSLHSNLISSHLISFYFTSQSRPFIFLVVAHLDGVAVLSSPTWWIISCTAYCKTIWWTCFPPTEPKALIILGPSQGAPAQELRRLRTEWMAPLLWSFGFFFF